MYRSKAYVCNQCRNVTAYSVKEAGTTIPCRFCGASLTLPCDKDFHPDPADRKKNTWLFCLLFLVSLVGIVFWRFSIPQTRAEKTLLHLPLSPAFFQDRRAVAPASVKVPGVQATVAVTDVYYGCPDIYYSSLGKTTRTETPVCCVRVEITNTGDKTAGFHSWRIFEAFSDQEKATLTDANGTSYNLVSFGVDSTPVGMQQKADIEAGALFTDLILFLCEAKPTEELELTLPSANLAGKGKLRFTIPSRMIR